MKRKGLAETAIVLAAVLILLATVLIVSRDPAVRIAAVHEFPETSAAELAEDLPAGVFVTKSGKRYHTDSTCSGMKNPAGLTLKEAESLGYEPCSKCAAPQR